MCVHRPVEAVKAVVHHQEAVQDHQAAPVEAAAVQRETSIF